MSGNSTFSVFVLILLYEILDWSVLKTFADDEIKATKKIEFVLERVENIMGKEENAGYQHFLLFPQSFLMPPE